MLIRRFPSGPLHTNTYVVICLATREAAIIDASPDSAALVIPYLEREHLKPVKILLTHSHWDHIADLSVLKKILNVPVYIHEFDAPNIISPGSDGLDLSFPIEAVHPDVMLKGGEKISVGNLSFDVIHTPGHSPGCVCFYEPNQKTLLSGDTLFKQSMGSLSLPTGDADSMWPSLKKLSELPPETEVYPGHGPRTTIGEESWLANAKNVFG